MRKIVITHVAIQIGQRVYALPPPSRHHDVIRTFHLRLRGGVAGFLTSTGFFLDRKKAYQLALNNGQLNRRPGLEFYQGPELFSEDLWTNTTWPGKKETVIPTMPEESLKFNKHLTTLIKCHGYTVEDLSFLCGVTPKYLKIQTYLNSKVSIRLMKCIALVLCLNLKAEDELIRRAKAKNTELKKAHPFRT